METPEEKQVKEIIHSEIKDCSTKLYPSICKLKASESGFEKIFRMTFELICDSGMSVRSALAQVESSL